MFYRNITITYLFEISETVALLLDNLFPPHFPYHSNGYFMLEAKAF